MGTPNHLIFRPEAVQHYLARHEKAVLPRFASPRTFLLLWLVLGLLVSAAAYMGALQIPVHATGQGVAAGLPDAGDRHLLLFLPPEVLPDLRVGQPVLLHVESSGDPLSMTIVAVEPEILSPTAARQRFGLGASAARALQQPAAVVLVSGGRRFSGQQVPPEGDSVFPIQVVLERRRALSVLLDLNESQASQP